ncbi:RdgB/HAM1 family non-canonical purine NTP pyrophosphatase [Gemella sp. GH3]|uniref:RdgB/HAM1 family non-canonical purine NTP pyrophosphatase n=1 Tax=unclassified Gemella TaxID=2624949 RepID=UPI0015D085B9|nr:MULTISPECIES: RdgB/HAM1 family non-canonical purine NTP pyrophosphatase [unclassified Gemella]MBF0713184.1 RdgB/HAM1 family non-canonical purine NTP pyrophosphatase [Gemella sp. GH3.1]NYS50136.1 RdgB/HAM1 family non-canonical purine NTP pyrophosphatase [Gemella sp. GH3]
MKELVLASNNKHKKDEIQSILTGYKILTLEDIGFFDEIVEDETTFEGNSLKKARIVAQFSGKDTIADDSGLCIELLNGDPGVYSARYSDKGTDEANIDKVLDKLNGRTSKAVFVSVISLVTKNGEEHSFRGECSGEIITERLGDNGFGYDPIFYVPSFKKTFAELSALEKNSISHRKEALKLLVDFLGK